MNLDFNNLTKFHKEILKKLSLWQHQHKCGLPCRTLYTYFFYEQYTEKEICDALDELERLGFVTKIKGPVGFTYELVDKQYLIVKSTLNGGSVFKFLRKKPKILLFGSGSILSNNCLYYCKNLRIGTPYSPIIASLYYPIPNSSPETYWLFTFSISCS